MAHDSSSEANPDGFHAVMNTETRAPNAAGSESNLASAYSNVNLNANSTSTSPTVSTHAANDAANAGPNRDDDEDYLDDDDAFNGRNQQQAGSMVVPQTKCNQAAIDQLLKRTGFSIVQENGQRKYAPSSPASIANVKKATKNDQSPPDRGCEVFVGKIPRDCFEDELIPVLERAGVIYEFRLMMEYSGFNRGYGFVMYTSREDAKKAVRELNNYEIRKGRMIGLCRSVDNCRLFVGGIPKNKKREEILEEMKKITDDVVNVIVYPSAHDKSKNRGFAFVQYTCHRAAAVARRKLIPARIQLFGQPIAVDWAEPEPEVDEDIMATVKVLYVRNLMLHTTEDQIKREFEKIKENSIERVKKMKDFAFVHFKEREDALNAMKAMNGATIDGSVVEVTLSKPVDKTNLARLTRGNTPSPTNPLLIAGLNAVAANDLNFLLGTSGLAKSGLSLPQLIPYSGGINFNDPNLAATIYPYQQFHQGGLILNQQQQQLASALQPPLGVAPQLYQTLNPHQGYFQSAAGQPYQVTGPSFQFSAAGTESLGPGFAFPQSTYPISQAGYIQNYSLQQQQQQQNQSQSAAILYANNASSQAAQPSIIINSQPMAASSQQQIQVQSAQQKLTGLASNPASMNNANNSRVLRANVGSRMPNVSTAAMGVYGRTAYNMYRGNNSSSSIGGPSVKKQATHEDAIFEMYSGLKPVPTLPLATSSVLTPSLTGMQSAQAVAAANYATSAKSSVQLLEEVCLKEGLSLPIYTLQTSTSKDQDGRDVTLFMCKVMVQNLFNNENMTTNQLLRSADEAKNNAADLVLSQLYVPQQPQLASTINQADLNELYSIQQQQLKQQIQANQAHLNTSISASDINKQALQNAVAAATASTAAPQYIIDSLNGQLIFCPQPQ